MGKSIRSTFNSRTEAAHAPRLAIVDSGPKRASAAFRSSRARHPR